MVTVVPAKRAEILPTSPSPADKMHCIAPFTHWVPEWWCSSHQLPVQRTVWHHGPHPRQADDERTKQTLPEEWLVVTFVHMEMQLQARGQENMSWG